MRALTLALLLLVGARGEAIADSVTRWHFFSNVDPLTDAVSPSVVVVVHTYSGDVTMSFLCEEDGTGMRFAARGLSLWHYGEEELQAAKWRVDDGEVVEMGFNAFQDFRISNHRPDIVKLARAVGAAKDKIVIKFKHATAIEISETGAAEAIPRLLDGCGVQ